MHKIASVLLCAAVSLSGCLEPCYASGEIGAYRAGDVTVYRIADKKGGVPPQVLVGADKAMLENVLQDGVCPAMFLTFLVKTPEDLILVDTGNGAESNGRTVELLKKLGVSREAVGKVLLTHMHGDHVRGLFTGNARTFPNAEVYVGEAEYRFWMDRKNASRAPSSMGACFDNAERMTRLYKGKIRLFKAGDRLFPWLAAVALPGHTEGHAGFLLERGGKRLFLAGDFMHCLAVQTAHPDVAVVWDSDQELAKMTRRQTLERVANTDTVVLGAHFANPGAVHFRQAGGTFSYKFVQPDAE